MFLGVGHKFFECFPLIAFRGCLRDFEHLNDLTTVAFGVAVQSIYLNIEGKPFSLLFARANTRKSNVFLHGYGSLVRQRYGPYLILCPKHRGLSSLRNMNPKRE